MGTAITYGVPVYGAPVQTTLLPTPDAISNTRSADSTSDKYNRPANSREAATPSKADGIPAKRTSNETSQPFSPFPQDGARVDRSSDTHVSAVSRKVPSAVRTGGWRPTGSLATAKAESQRGPKLVAPSVASNK